MLLKRPRPTPSLTRTSNRIKNIEKKPIAVIVSDSNSDIDDDDNTLIEVDDDISSDDSDFMDEDQHVNKRSKSFLNHLSDKRLLTKIPPPPSRISKGYDAQAVLTKKFKIPTIQNNNGQAATFPSDIGSRKSLGMRKRAGHLMRALYDHTAEDAVVLWDPDKDYVQEELKITTDKPKPKQKSLADILGLKKEEKKLGHVVVDPVLGRVLRPHQVEGVKFLYQCTTGKVHPDAAG